MVTACGGKEKIKEKLRAATEAVKERKEAAASEKGSDLEMDKQGDRPDNGAFVDPSLTPASVRRSTRRIRGSLATSVWN